MVNPHSKKEDQMQKPKAEAKPKIQSPKGAVQNAIEVLDQLNQGPTNPNTGHIDRGFKGRHRGLYDSIEAAENAAKGIYDAKGKLDSHQLVNFYEHIQEIHASVLDISNRNNPPQKNEADAKKDMLDNIEKTVSGIEKNINAIPVLRDTTKGNSKTPLTGEKQEMQNLVTDVVKKIEPLKARKFFLNNHDNIRTALDNMEDAARMMIDGKGNRVDAQVEAFHKAAHALHDAVNEDKTTAGKADESIKTKILETVEKLDAQVTKVADKSKPERYQGYRPEKEESAGKEEKKGTSLVDPNEFRGLVSDMVHHPDENAVSPVAGSAIGNKDKSVV